MRRSLNACRVGLQCPWQWHSTAEWAHAASATFASFPYCWHPTHRDDVCCHTQPSAKHFRKHNLYSITCVFCYERTPQHTVLSATRTMKTSSAHLLLVWCCLWFDGCESLTDTSLPPIFSPFGRDQGDSVVSVGEANCDGPIDIPYEIFNHTTLYVSWHGRRTNDNTLTELTKMQ